MQENMEEKLFVRLLECWVLDALGGLEDRDRELMESLAPKLSEIYEREGDWKTILSEEMEFPQDMREIIEKMYQKYQEEVQEGRVVLGKDDFARMFVRDNFLSDQE